MTALLPRLLRPRLNPSVVVQARKRSCSTSWLVGLAVLMMALAGFTARADAQTSQPTVQPTTQNAVVNTQFIMNQRVINTNNVAENYTLALTCPSGWNCGVNAPNPQSIAPHDG